MPHFAEPAPAYSPTSTYDDCERSNMRKSFFGSVKDKLSRKSNPSSQNSKHITQSNMSRSNNPFAHPPAAKQPNREFSPSIIVTPPTPTSSSDHRPAPNQPPPAYTVTASPQSGADYLAALGGPVRSPSPAPSNADSIMSAAGMSVSTPEDPYAFLSSFDTIFVVDDSGSMAGRSWPEVQNVLRAITPICTSHDDDGVDLYFLNNKTSDSGNARAGKAAGGYYGIRRAETVHEIFTMVRPRGATPTGQRLHAIVRAYLQLLESKKHDVESVKPINIIVITDGAPSDDVESTIISAAKKLDKLDAPMHQVGVQFFQVGNEPGAREALRELDDDLVNRVDVDLRDMVDTVTWEHGNRGVLTADSILKVVLGAVVRRLDRRRTSGESRR
ncbi:von willebrand factor [Colletotrichum incanum]|uniref:von willebrand factor n=1 Tax=Colletotrichum incanum TaxID=1573173 RepID=A0A161VZ55_COLIC|nr:von willebrand factor [Colletotrichum incanum]